jgi:hypothetical protein
MAWSTPLTAVAGTALTAAQWNASVRDNLLETPAAKATTAGTLFVGAGPNSIAERFLLQHTVDTAETTTSTAYTSLGTNGPTVTLTCGGKALVWIIAELYSSATGTTVASFEITGATTTAAADSRSILNDNGPAAIRSSSCSLMTTNPGSNTFRMLYRTTSGTGTYLFRHLVVMAL